MDVSIPRSERDRFHHTDCTKLFLYRLSELRSKPAWPHLAKRVRKDPHLLNPLQLDHPLPLLRVWRVVLRLLIFRPGFKP